MTNTSLAESYLIKARVRLDVLEVYLDKEAYSGVGNPKNGPMSSNR